MNSLTLYAIIFSCIGHAFASQELSSPEERKNRQFSLFSVVTFKNSQCTAKSAGISGVCFTATECTDKSGTADGNCAAAFGVCCLLKANTCSATVDANCTYIENPGYPTLYSSSGACSYTVNKCATDICQIRLDFTATTLKQPTTTTGVCSTGGDTLTITGGGEGSVAAGQSGVPVLCGTLTGQHIYLDAGISTSAATIAFSIGTASTSSWRIKVTQIECWNPSRAPNGCLQYFTGRTNTVTSFNFDGDACTGTGCHLDDQNYTVCFRPEEGMCGVQYSESALSSSKNAFNLTNGQTVGKVSIANCGNGYVQIVNDVVANGDKFCGDLLTAIDAETVAGTIYSPKFQFQVVAPTDVAQNLNAGFSLQVTQSTCAWRSP